MAKAASPLMLFLLGASFRFSSMKGQVRELIAVCVGRLIVIPAIFLTLAALLGFRGLDFVGLLCVFASCTAVSSFSMAQQMGGDADLAGNIVVMTSLLCSVTLFLWSFVFLSLGIF
jgi:predicted permease